MEEERRKEVEEGGGGRRWRRGEKRKEMEGGGEEERDGGGEKEVEEGREGLEAHVVVGTQVNFNRFDDWSTDLECLHYLVKLAVVQVPWTKDVFLHIPAQFPW